MTRAESGGRSPPQRRWTGPAMIFWLRSYAMHANYLGSRGCVLVALCFFVAIPMNANQFGDWKTYELNVMNAHACAFTPDGVGVVVLNWESHLISEKPWQVVY